MALMHNGVAVIGTGYSTLARRQAKSSLSLTTDAVRRAVDDAGISVTDIDGLGTSPSMPVYGGTKSARDGIDVVTPQLLARALGIAETLEWAGTTLSMVTASFSDAVDAVQTGRCRFAVVYRALTMPQGRYSSIRDRAAHGRDQFYAPIGFTMPAAWAGTVMQRYCALTGATRNDFDRYILHNRLVGAQNPRAFFADRPLHEDDLVNPRVIAEPLTMLDCDIPVDGSVAMVLTDAVTARTLHARPALVRSTVMSHGYSPTGVYMSLDHMLAGARALGERVWRDTGWSARGVDAVQAYDGFSVLAPVWLEGLGLSPTGEGLIALRGDGGLLTNTNGGCLAEGRLHGMTQLVGAAELVLQDRASRSLATVSNGLAGSAVVAFSSE